MVAFLLAQPALRLPQVVLGWYGSKDRHVAKYSELLNRQGYAAVRAIMPNAAVFSPFDGPRRRFAARLLDFLDSLSPTLGDRKIVFYIFSNGGSQPGCHLWSILAVTPGDRLSPRLHAARRIIAFLLHCNSARLCRPAVSISLTKFSCFPAGGGFALEQVDKLVQGSKAYRHFAGRIAATVFDSAPCYMHKRAGARAVAEGLSGPARLLAVVLFYLYLACLRLVAPNKPQLYW
jgi:hypothetical protein